MGSIAMGCSPLSEKALTPRIINFDHHIYYSPSGDMDIIINVEFFLVRRFELYLFYWDLNIDTWVGPVGYQEYLLLRGNTLREIIGVKDPGTYRFLFVVGDHRYTYDVVTIRES